MVIQPHCFWSMKYCYIKKNSYKNIENKKGSNFKLLPFFMFIIEYYYLFQNINNMMISLKALLKHEHLNLISI